MRGVSVIGAPWVRRAGRVATAAACLLILAATPGCSRAAAGPGSGTEGPLTRAPDGRRLELTFREEFDQFRPWRGTDGIWRTTFGDGSKSGVGVRTLSA